MKTHIIAADENLYIEKAAELLTLLYLYGCEWFILNKEIYQLTRMAQLIFNLRGGEKPEPEATILINQKLKTLENPGYKLKYFEINEAAKNIEWVKWWNDRYHFTKK